MEKLTVTVLSMIILTLAVIMDTNNMASAGKCSGKWAIHACVGGNGKRADPSDTQWKLSDYLARRRDALNEARNENLARLASVEDLDSADGSTWETDNTISTRPLASDNYLRQSLRDLRRNSRFWQLLMSSRGGIGADDLLGSMEN